ncbi:MAG: flagellar hook-associated protein FlgK [Candidatus Neomarinimicrobiota bacterium]
MAGISFLAEIGKQGMLLSQFALQIAGKNISNVNTRGYSRQRVDVSPILPELLAGFSLGSAINGDTLRRIREDFVDRQFWTQNSLYSQYETEDSLMRQIEGVLPSSNEAGLGTMLDEFWIAWNELANDPESSVSRTIVRDKAQTLTLSFNRVYKEYVSVKSMISSDIQVRVTEINQLASQIAELNKSGLGDNPDVNDQRDRLVERLSDLTNVEMQRDGDTVTVYIAGLQLVSGTNAYEIALEETPGGAGGITTIIGGTAQQIQITSGELGGLLGVYNNDIPDLLARLDTLAVTIADEVNAIHKTGYNLAGVTGLNFFADTTEGAASMAVDSAIIDDVDLIATGDVSGEPGNGNTASAIADLMDNKVIGNQTIGEYYRGLVGTMGNRVQEIGFLKNNQQKIVEHLQMQQHSVSGVSMEEEMITMVQLEQAFTAASRLVSIADELVRTVLNLI